MTYLLQFYDRIDRCGEGKYREKTRIRENSRNVYTNVCGACHAEKRHTVINYCFTVEKLKQW